ncbi:MAG: hypothetical protein CVV27_05035 [Candidatus Melainabacteria bacterium HGW-Melainabacteria-1]|nr:MAG: hypothetical protein CVV27_05035 [Candidatus Melainabacteria bacterium HGW-Melainabacteria-1]
MKIAFQGVRGANSEVGIRQHFGDLVEAMGYPFSEDVFEAVLEGECHLGYVPVENSIAGNVAINNDLLYRHDVRVIGEDYVPIRHCLLTMPGVKLEQLRRVYSHPVALAQCRPFLNQWGLTAMPDFDTAGPPQHVPKGQAEDKTSLVFIARHSPGALVACLEQFARHGLNMTRLESRPIPENPFAYMFFVDFIGALHEPQVRQCLAEMSRSTQFIKILGSYPLGARLGKS